MFNTEGSDAILFGKQHNLLEEMEVWELSRKIVTDLSHLRHITDTVNELISADEHVLTCSDVGILLIDYDVEEYLSMLQMFTIENKYKDAMALVAGYLETVGPLFKEYAQRGLHFNLETITYNSERLFKLPDEFVVLHDIVYNQDVIYGIWTVARFKGGHDDTTSG